MRRLASSSRTAHEVPPFYLALIVSSSLSSPLRNRLLNRIVVTIEVDKRRARRVARKLQKQTGQTGVPVIRIGSKWIVGFDKLAIERELARKS